MYQSQQRSADLCIDFYIHSTQDSLCGGYCLRSNLLIVNTSGKAGAQIPQLPLGDDSTPWGR
jgi:hypothetical protein